MYLRKWKYHLASIIDHSVITWDEIIEETFPKNFNEKTSLQNT